MEQTRDQNDSTQWPNHPDIHILGPSFCISAQSFLKHFLADDILRKLPGKSLKTAADCLAVITYSVINLDIELSSFAQFLFTSTQCFKVIVKTCGATHMHTHQLTQMGPISDITKKWRILARPETQVERLKIDKNIEFSGN